MKSWFENNSIEMYSTHNERKFAVAERLIKTLKENFYKYIYKNVYIEKFNKYNDTYLRTIKMKPVGGKSSTSMLLVILKAKKLLERFTKE